MSQINFITSHRDANAKRNINNVTQSSHQKQKQAEKTYKRSFFYSENTKQILSTLIRILNSKFANSICIL